MEMNATRDRRAWASALAERRASSMSRRRKCSRASRRECLCLYGRAAWAADGSDGCALHREVEPRVLGGGDAALSAAGDPSDEGRARSGRADPCASQGRACSWPCAPGGSAPVAAPVLCTCRGAPGASGRARAGAPLFVCAQPAGDGPGAPAPTPTPWRSPCRWRFSCGTSCSPLTSKGAFSQLRFEAQRKRRRSTWCPAAAFSVVRTSQGR